MLQKIDLNTVKENPFSLIGEQWALLSAGDQGSFNTMTVSWAGMGFLWKKPVTMIYVRPQRYTYEFTEKSDYYTLTFFAPGEQREALTLCGTKSGRDMDKFAASGLTPAFAGCGAPYAAEGELVLVCRKLYAQDLEERCFLNREVMETCYPLKDYHRMYVGEVIEAYQRV